MIKNNVVECPRCQAQNVLSVFTSRYQVVKERDTVSYDVKYDSDSLKEKEVKVFTDEHVILLLMDAVQGKELLSAGFVEAFEFLRSSLIIKPQVKLEEL